MHLKRLRRVIGALLLPALACIAVATAETGSRDHVAADPTPAEQCVKDGYAIPTVLPHAGLAAAKRRSFRTVSGWAFLDADTPLGGARVRILNAAGQRLPLLAGSTTRTGPEGSFLLAVKRLPAGWRIVASGGTQGGRPFDGTLITQGSRGTQYVNPVTTLVDLYHAAHPLRPQARAVAVIKRTLEIPAEVNLTTDLRYSDRHFDAQKFLGRGAFSRTVRAILARAERGGQVSFTGSAKLGESSLETEFLEWAGGQIAGGAASYVGGLGAGWVLGQIGIQDGAASQLAQIQSALDGINKSLAALGDQLRALNAKADDQILATLITPLRNARSAISGKVGDMATIAELADEAAKGRTTKKYLESQACAALAGLYPLASGTIDFGYFPDLLKSAFFAEPGVTSLPQAFVNVVKNQNRFFTSAASQRIAEMIQYYTAIEQNWLQIELEWQHAVHPCPTSAPEDCLATDWAARYLSDARAQFDTLPMPVADGVWVDQQTGQAWAPGYAPAAGILPHQPPMTYNQAFGPLGDWINCPQDPETRQCLSRPLAGIAGACQDTDPKTRIPDARDVAVCQIYFKSDPGPFSTHTTRYSGFPTSWVPPNGDQIGALVNGYQGAGSPLKYLTNAWDDPQHPGAGASKAWLDQGGDWIWIYGCCDGYNLNSPSVERPPADRAGFLVTGDRPIDPAHYLTVGGSTRFTLGRGDSYVRYVSRRGSDSNDCTSYVKPCKTLTHAVAVAGYSKVIELGGGTFTGPVTLDKDISIVGAGPGLTTIDAGGSSHAITVDGIPADIRDVTITGAGGSGLSLAPRRTGYGPSVATLSNVNISGNGRGIENAGTLTMARSTIGPNTVDGIDTVDGSTTSLTNTTVAANGAYGIWNAGGSTTLLNSSVVRNAFTGVLTTGGTVSIGNTLLAGQHYFNDGDCAGPLQAMAGVGHNVIAGIPNSCTFDPNGSSGNLTAPLANPLDAKIGTLGPNGGTTSTVPLQTGSPAIGAGNAATCLAQPVGSLDQRGYVRPSGSCDIGAFDSKAQNIPPP
jgi:hypothetical protein